MASSMSLPGIERLARDILSECPHRVAAVGVLGEQHRDLVETGGDRGSDATVAGIDDEAVAIAMGIRDDDGRLDDADGGNRRLQ